jgi:hypothetical protein
VDTVNRRRLMIFCALCQALVVAAVPLVHHWGRLSPALLALVSFLLATGSAFFVPARDAIIPHLVEGAKLHRANSLMQMSMQLAYLGGPVLAGALVDFTGIIGLFTVDALSFVASALLLLLIAMPGGVPLHPPAEPVPVPDLPRAAGGSLRDIHQGLAYAWRDGRLRGLLVLTALDNFFIMGRGPARPAHLRARGAATGAVLLRAADRRSFLRHDSCQPGGGNKRPALAQGQAHRLRYCSRCPDLPASVLRRLLPQAALAMFVHGADRAAHYHQPGHAGASDGGRSAAGAGVCTDKSGGGGLHRAERLLMVGPLCGWLGVQNMFLLVASSGVLFALGGVAFRQLWRAA